MIDLFKDLYGLMNTKMSPYQIIEISNEREELEKYVKEDNKYSVWRLICISGEPEALICQE